MSTKNLSSVMKLRDLEIELDRTEKTIERLISYLAETASAVDFHAGYLAALRAEIQLRKDAREPGVVPVEPVTFMEIQTA